MNPDEEFNVEAEILSDQEISKEEKNKNAVAAIIPAYNEEQRIAKVLDTLTKTKLLKEIIVVDDGSTDNTGAVVKEFKSVKYLKNSRNMGKSFSMEKGVNATQVPIIFFCDADVEGLTPESVEEIINPVLNREYVMFIGLRSNLLQKLFKLFAINSGERALKRELWEELPRYYKHRYRIETGLNYIAQLRGERIGYKIFKHYHTVKEFKHGIIKGTLLRLWMNFDVTMALLRSRIVDRFKFR